MIIADLFHRMGKVERIGSGIEKMRSLMREAGLKRPVFEVENFFRVIFYRSLKYALKTTQEATQKTTGKELVERLVGGLAGRLAESQRKILEFVSENPRVSRQELSGKIGISTTAIDKNIKALKKKGLLKRIGPAKGGRWKIKG